MEKKAKWMRDLQLKDESSIAGNLKRGLFSKEIHGRTEADQRSIYVGNVDYDTTAEELESFFLCCGKIKRVTVVCDRLSGYPKGYAYIEFEEQSSIKTAMTLHMILFRGRIIKVLPKRTNLPGMSTTNSGFYQGHFRGWKRVTQWGSSYGKQDTAEGGNTGVRQRCGLTTYQKVLDDLSDADGAEMRKWN